jgi:hypothetical protein
MTLSKQDADLFFQLMLSLHFFVNEKLNINSNITTNTELSQEEKFTIRETLFEQPHLIDEYIVTNPEQFDKDKLFIVQQWKKFIKEEFYIERYLKNHAIFISGENAYAVVALYQEFDEIIDKSHLPLCTKVILLPFKGKIIYDGLIESYNVHFGGGIKRSLKETYMKAKQNGRIITTLENIKESNITLEPAKPTYDWSKEILQLNTIAKKLKGGAGQPAINSSVFSLVKASIELANKTVVESGSYEEIYKEFKRVNRALKKVDMILYRMD